MVGLNLISSMEYKGLFRIACFCLWLNLVGTCLSGVVLGQDQTPRSIQMERPAYRLYDGQGQALSWSGMVSTLEKQDVVLFGELHNNTLTHYLQLQVMKELDSKASWVLGMEMFSREDSLLLAEYHQGLVKDYYFNSDAATWDNFSTDYKPLLEYAKANWSGVYGTNVPRRYAGMAAKFGVGFTEKIGEVAQAFLPPLPIEVDEEEEVYAQMKKGMAGHGGGGKGMNKMVYAQALKDASMAYVISCLLQQDKKVFHVHGAFHSLNGQGIGTYLQQYAEGASFKTITCKEVEDINHFPESARGDGDYVLLFPKDMSKSY